MNTSTKDENTEAQLSELLGRPPRTEMKCRVCGCYSSAQVCWHCATNPVMLKLTLLQEKLREYLAEPSLDGRSIRQKQRQELLEMINS